MSSLLALVESLLPEGRARVQVRNERVDAALPGAGVRIQAGDLVLLTGKGPPWVIQCWVARSLWPRELPPSLDVLRSARRPPERVSLGVPSSHGSWKVDPEGRPCEVGFGAGDAPYSVILNYSGWKLSDLAGGVVEVVPCDFGGAVVWIIRASFVPSPPDPPSARPQAPAAHSLERWEFPRSPPPPPPETLPAVAPATPVAEPFDLKLRFVDLTFAEGSVRFHRVRTVTVISELAHEVYNDVRVELDRELPAGVRAVGVDHHDGHVSCELRGLEALASTFERVQQRLLIASAVESPRWVDADKLSARLPGGRESGLDAILGVPEFNLARRAEAYRRMFVARDPGETVRVLGGRAVVVPLRAADGGRPWFAWEKTNGDYATYLFRPSDDAQRDRMLAWAEEPSNRRRDLLADKALRAELAFVARVMHRASGGDALAGWWREVMGVVSGAGR